MRWLFPIMRRTGVALHELPEIVNEGVRLEVLSLLQTRVRHEVAMDAISALVVRADDAALGLRAAGSFAPGDFDSIELVASSAPTLRAALACLARYLPLLHEGLYPVLTEKAQRAHWVLTARADVRSHPVANEYALALLASLLRNYCIDELTFREVRFEHPRPADTSAHAESFGSARLVFRARQNVLVFDAALLDRPMKLAHRGLHEVHEAHAREQLDKFELEGTLRGRVRQLLVQQLCRGEVSRADVASRLATTESSLRRRLAQEGTTYREQLDYLRRELAEHYLADQSLAIGEVGHMLGFRETGSFYKAFHRWFGRGTPAGTRKRQDPP